MKPFVEGNNKQGINTIDHIYLQIDWKKTKPRIAKHIDQYNDRIKKEEPHNYGKKALKATHEATTIAVLEQFSAFLRHNEIKKLSERQFYTNNHALAAQRNDRISPVTVWRHMKRLEEANILIKQPWEDEEGKRLRSSNSGYTIQFNPDILIAAHNFEYCEQRVNQYLERVENDQSDLKTIHQLKMERPSFKDAPLGSMVSFCKHTSTCTSTGSNCNIEKGISTTQAARGIEERETKGREHGSMKRKKEGGAAARITEFAWAFACSVLWSGKDLLQADIRAAKMFIRMYFESATGKPDKMNRIYDHFIQRVVLARRYILRSPERFTPNPALWFDPHFEYGFRGTKKWYDAVRQKRKYNREFYSNVKEVSYYYRKYCEDPNMTNYTLMTRRLGRKHDKSWLRIFNEAIENTVELTPEFFEKLFKEVA